MLQEEAQQVGNTSAGFIAESAKRTLGRIGTPEENRAGSLVSASDASSFVTGTSLVVDGGGLSGWL
jgi:NAD(P)-dependent dehydrogenase (short-subunit alcohol dehydrogenase family)